MQLKKSKSWGPFWSCQSSPFTSRLGQIGQIGSAVQLVAPKVPQNFDFFQVPWVLIIHFKSERASVAADFLRIFKFCEWKTSHSRLLVQQLEDYDKSLFFQLVQQAYSLVKRRSILLFNLVVLKTTRFLKTTQVLQRDSLSAARSLSRRALRLLLSFDYI